MGVKKPDESPYLMVCIEFIIAIAIALFFISLAMNNFTALPAQSAMLILMLLCIPLLLIIYWTADDAKLKSVISGLIVFFLLEALSGIFWYVLPQVEAFAPLYSIPALLDVAMLIMPLAYLPLLYVLVSAVSSKWPGSATLVYPILGLCTCVILGISAYLCLYVYSHPPALYGAVIFGYAMIGDVLAVGLCAILIIANTRQVGKYLYAIIFGAFFLSFLGDTLGAISGLGIYDASNYSQIAYSIMMGFVTLTLLLYSMGSVNRALVDRLNQELYDTRRLVDDLLRYTPDAMCVAAADGKVVRANEQFCKIIGWSQDEAVGSYDIFADLSRMGKDLSDPLTLLKAGSPAKTSRLEAGSEGRIFRVKMFPTYTRAGKVSSYILVLEDVTELERAIDALKQAHDELELRVEQRTEELAAANCSLMDEIEERKAAEDRLLTSLAEKDVLLKEVHHRVKNNLQVVTSLLNLQIGDLKDPYDIRIFRESQNRIRSIALVHENVYQTGDLSWIDFARYADLLVRQLRQSFSGQIEHVHVIVDIPGVSIDMNKAITCGLIINELLSDALDRYAACGQGGEIYIGFHAVCPGKLVLQVHDRQFSPINHHGGALSDDLLEVLVEQLEGTMSVDSARGLAYTITFVA